MRAHSLRSTYAGLVTIGLVAVPAVWAGFRATGFAQEEQKASAVQRGSDHERRGGFEVWIADQSDTRPGFGGQLLVYEGAHLMGKVPSTRSPSSGSIWAPRPRTCVEPRPDGIPSGRT